MLVQTIALCMTWYYAGMNQNNLQEKKVIICHLRLYKTSTVPIGLCYKTGKEHSRPCFEAAN